MTRFRFDGDSLCCVSPPLLLVMASIQSGDIAISNLQWFSVQAERLQIILQLRSSETIKVASCLAFVGSVSSPCFCLYLCENINIHLVFVLMILCKGLQECVEYRANLYFVFLCFGV